MRLFGTLLIAATFAAPAWAAAPPAQPGPRSSAQGAAAPDGAQTLEAGDPVVFRAMEKELERDFAKLKNAEETPLYYLGYQITETRTYSLNAKLGAINDEDSSHDRILTVDMRIGSPQFDNTHEMKGANAWMNNYRQTQSQVTVEDDEDSLRSSIWLATEDAFKEALNDYTRLKANAAVTAESEDRSADFSKEASSRYFERVSVPAFDAETWKARCRKLSETFKKYPFIFDSNVYLGVRAFNRYSVDSEGSRIQTGNVFIRAGYSLGTQTEDGMRLSRSNYYDARRPEDLPDDEKIMEDMEASIAELQALKDAPLVHPYSGPAILKNRAAGVYFHEILGHRLEGHRQKSEQEGQTFTKKIGKPIVASFISVVDDPTSPDFNGQSLRGFYRFDEENVPAQKVVLVENGILRNFLMSRSEIQGFAHSNGHGRRQSGNRVVARMGNLMVRAAETVSYERLRELLIEECKKQDKPYGLVFDDIQGGFTGTDRSGPQSFKVLPLLVRRVYADGRPDEVVRGVDIVGTPLTSFTKIIAAADDDAVFNGTCGAESGWVPVSAVAPSILISEMEVERRGKSQEKPPILPPPLFDHAIEN
ncbi:MAG: peptidase U62 [Elusimicrobia bacterium]|nr:peptidase U62 [Elusimicrobiota bacterium]